MNKDEFAAALAKESGLYKYQAIMFIEAFTKVMIDILSSGENLKLHGFGQFKTRLKAERIAKNPLTQEKCIVPKRYKAIFVCGTELEKAIAEMPLPKESETSKKKRKDKK